MGLNLLKAAEKNIKCTGLHSRNEEISGWVRYQFFISVLQNFVVFTECRISALCIQCAKPRSENFPIRGPVKIRIGSVNFTYIYAKIR